MAKICICKTFAATILYMELPFFSHFVKYYTSIFFAQQIWMNEIQHWKAHQILLKTSISLNAFYQIHF